MIIDTIKKIINRCEFYRKCKHYSKDNFNCNNQKSVLATKCGIRRYIKKHDSDKKKENLSKDDSKI